MKIKLIILLLVVTDLSAIIGCYFYAGIGSAIMMTIMIAAQTALIFRKKPPEGNFHD